HILLLDLHSFPTRRSSDLLFPQWSEIYGMNFLETVNVLVSNWVIPIGGLLSAVFVGWFMDPKIAESQIGSKKIYRPWRFFVRYLDRKSTRLNSSHVKISYA